MVSRNTRAVSTSRDQYAAQAIPLDEVYFAWLYSQVASTEIRNKAQTYWTLLRLLYRKQFYWTTKVPLDANRASDGQDLRLRFFNRDLNTLTAEESEWIQEPCSVLEMLIALANAVSFEGGGTPSDRFWEMIENVGLIGCNDAHPPIPEGVEMLWENILRRNYDFNGHGGLFPLLVNDKQEDQREVQLWMQANAYLLERL